jgi:hypothetical protein
MRDARTVRTPRENVMTPRLLRRSATAAALLAGSAARASGDSGTSAMGEMQLSGAHLAILVGALLGLGAVFWLLAKTLNR